MPRAMPAVDLRSSSAIAHLMDVLNAGKDIGHHGRAVFAIVAASARRLGVRFDPFLQLIDLVGDLDHRQVERDARIVACRTRPEAGQAVAQEVEVDLHDVERLRPLLHVADELHIGPGNQVEVTAQALDLLVDVGTEIGRKAVGAVADLYLHVNSIFEAATSNRQGRPARGPRDRRTVQAVRTAPGSALEHAQRPKPGHWT